MGLTTNLVAVWENEASFVDSVAGLTLTNNNTATFPAGKVGNGAAFSGLSSQYASIADHATLSLGADSAFGWFAWVKANSISGSFNNCVISKWDSAAGQREYFMDHDFPSDRFRFAVRGADDATNGIVQADTLGSPSTGLWYWLGGWHDPVANKIYISANNQATPNELAFSAGTRNGTANFYMGAVNFGAGISNFWDGIIDQVLFYKDGFPNATEQTTIYNGGAGMSYAAMVAADAGGGVVPIISSQYRRRRIG